MQQMSAGRNDPCPCGSGKKFKKCCQLVTTTAPTAPPFAGTQKNEDVLSAALQHFNCGDYSGALTLSEQLLTSQPQLASAHSLAGLSLHGLGNNQAAVDHLRQAVLLAPSSPSYYNLGVVLQALDELDAAADSYRHSVALQANADALGNLGGLAYKQGRFDEAIDTLARAIALRPNDAGAHNNLALALIAIGQTGLGIEHLRTALALKFPYEEAHSSLIFAMDLAPDITLAQQLAERRKWNELYAPTALTRRQHDNQPDPDRRLKVGYVSADLSRHSACTVFSAMLLHFDRASLDVHVYSNSHKEDEVTAWLKTSPTTWHNITDLSHEAAAEQIRRDGIDILVDLSGHSLGNRLPMFALKPAPIQISAWGYASSTGLAAMDVFFADPITVPPEEKPLYVEEVRYLPNLFSAHFLDAFPPVNSLPALTQGHITFGALNRMSKISDPSLQLWAAVLRSVPNSRLLIKTAELDNDSVRDHLLAQFAAQGIGAERLELQGRTLWREHMQTFNRVDIVLDPLPHGGGVSTLEAIRMGVPVVTLAVPTIAGRLSATIQHSVGLDDWIASTPQAYLDLAISKSADLATLAQLRSQLRSRIETSVLMDYAAYNRAVEKEYRSLWRDWCARQVT